MLNIAATSKNSKWTEYLNHVQPKLRFVHILLSYAQLKYRIFAVSNLIGAAKNLIGAAMACG